MVVVSRSGTEYHRAEPLDDWEALRWRELEWSDLPKTMYRGLISCLTVREAGRLDCAMTNREARPHLVKSYKGMQSPAFNGYVYMCEDDEFNSVVDFAIAEFNVFREMAEAFNAEFTDDPIERVELEFRAKTSKGYTLSVHRLTEAQETREPLDAAAVRMYLMSESGEYVSVRI